MSATEVSTSFENITYEVKGSIGLHHHESPKGDERAQPEDR